jgi:catechol 2,3-dioxygenase-like lactoylglutathione lyase family enzyme
MIRLGKGVPTLPCRSVPRSIAYYREKLGFELDWDDAELGFDHTMFAALSRDDCQLCLSEHEHDGSPPVTMWCFVSDAEALYRDFGARGAELGDPPKLEPWGEICFEVEDLDGNRLSFAQKPK